MKRAIRENWNNNLNVANIEISEVDHYTWILFTSRMFRLALEITFFFFPTNGLRITLIK